MTKSLIQDTQGPFWPVADMVVMVVVGSWSLGHVSTVGIVHTHLLPINLLFSLHIWSCLKFRWYVWTCLLNFGKFKLFRS